MTSDIPTVESIFIKGEGGGIFKLDLPLSEPIEDRLRKGYLTRVADADGTPYLLGETDEVPSLPTSRPALNAVKSEWVGWAVASGSTPDDAEALTKTDLIEKYGVNAAPEQVTGEPVPDGTEITAENAGIVTTADGVEHVGVLPSDGPQINPTDE